MKPKTEADKQAYENLVARLEDYIRCRRGECVFETECLRIICNEDGCEEG